MPVDLGKIRALLASAKWVTPGPWRVGRRCFGLYVGDREDPVIEDAAGNDMTGQHHMNNKDLPLIAAAPDLHRELTEAVGEIERLRAHNARMVAQINRLAEGCDRAARHRDPSYPAIGHIITALPGECAGQDWADLFAAAGVALGRLAAGEVDDG